MDSSANNNAESQFPLYVYSSAQMKKFEKTIVKSFGAFDSVLHEIVSPDIHLDVLVIPPTEEYPYYKLVTMGMGAYRMNVPDEFKKYKLEHAELVIFLPANWDIKSSDEKDFWPIRHLKNVARLPIYNDTWLGYGHSVSANVDSSPVAENTGFNSFALANAPALNGKSIRLRLGGKNINFYQLIPLYQEELEYKIENGMDALLDLFAEKVFSPIVNINRENYCK